MSHSIHIEEELNPPQRKAVRQTEGPVLIIAGAGSGKTRVLAYRAAHLVHSGLARPHQILALTFTNKAAAELRGRAAQMVGQDGHLLAAGTFHSLFARIMRQEGLNIGVDPRFTIVDADDRRRLIKEILKEMDAGAESARGVEWMIERAKNALTSPQRFADLARGPLELVAAQAYERYEVRLRRMAGLDFDDLLIRPIEAFGKHPDFLARLQNRFRYVMVDEFQDTNPAQYKLIKSIAGEHRNVCVVGDDDQAIYGFRGATVANILEFKHDWPDARVIRLEQNYRSHRYILEAAQSVIRHNPHRHEKKLWTARQDGEPTLLIEARSDEEEALRFIVFIQGERRMRSRALSDFAILYRTNAQSLQFERALRGAGLPYYVIGGLRFYERKEIKDVLAYLRVLVNPADEISLERIINYPPRGIGDAVVAELFLRSRRESVSVLDVMKRATTDSPLACGGDEGGVRLTTRARRALGEFLRIIGEMQTAARELPFPELVKRIIVITGLRERLREEEKADPSRAESKVANLDNLIAEVMRYAASPPLTPPLLSSGEIEGGVMESFLEEVALVTDADTADETQDRVNLLTIHSAKGLEFPVVLIGGLEEGLLPLAPPNGAPTEVEEERRLFFVGATRAMDRLVLGYAVERQRYGSRLWGGPSRFLAEIPPELLCAARRASSATSPVRRSSGLRRVAAPPGKESGPAGLDPDDIKRGLLVRHPTFGLGLVTDFCNLGLDSRLDVDFDEVGKKTLVLRYARLELA